MTLYYYSHQTNEFRQVDRMPPKWKSDHVYNDDCPCVKCSGYRHLVRAFNAYLSTLQPITHTFSGESRVVLPDQIEWVYEAKITFIESTWIETSEEKYNGLPDDQRRRVATPKITEGGKNTSINWYKMIYPNQELVIHDPDGWDRKNLQYSYYEELITREEFERRISMSTVMMQKVSEIGTALTGEPLNESYGYTSTSATSPEPLTSRPDRQGEGIVLKPTGRHFYAYWSNGAYLGILLKEVHGSFVFEQSPKAGYMDANVLLAVSKELDRLNNVRPSPSPQREDKDEMQTSQYLIGYDDGARDYKEVLEDHRRLVRELDVIINGEGAAKQASLCDIVAQLRKQPPAQSDQEAAEKWISDHGVKFMAIEQQRNAFLAGCTRVRAQQGEEIEKLKFKISQLEHQIEDLKHPF